VAARGGHADAGRRPAEAAKQKKKKRWRSQSRLRRQGRPLGCASGTGGMEPRPSAATVTAAGWETGGPGAIRRRRPRPSAARGGSVDRDQVPGGHRSFLLQRCGAHDRVKATVTHRPPCRWDLM
jgi:hypothetical protein